MRKTIPVFVINNKEGLFEGLLTPYLNSYIFSKIVCHEMKNICYKHILIYEPLRTLNVQRKITTELYIQIHRQFLKENL